MIRIKREAFGGFGKLAAQYDAMRPAYPKKVISIIYKASNLRRPIILDIGCGTGISTRQLAKNGASVIGCDPDSKMLKAASKHSMDNISYKRSKAEKLSFGDATFDIVTAFISFHWFMNKKSINEIKRVLKPHGLLCIIQPRYALIQKDFRAILENELSVKFPKNYKISTEIIPFLAKNGFNTRRCVIKSNVRYTVDEFVMLLQSYNLWNYVHVSHRKEMLDIIYKHFKKKAGKNYIRNIKDVEVIIASKML